jgi:hypothetical protein
MNHMFGNAASPMLAGELCVVNFGPDEKARVIAVNKKSGETVWEAQPPKIDPSEQQTRGNFAGGGGQGGVGAPGREGGRPGQGGGGRGGGGVGSGVAPQIFAQGDRNNDKKLTKEEFSAVADLWFDKVDPEKTGKLTQEQFAERFYDAVPRREEGGGDAPPAGERRVSRTTAPAFFGVADTDKDGALTRPELKATFRKWFTEWDSEKRDEINAEKLESGLNAVLPRANFAGGGPGGAGGRGGTNAFGGRGGSGGGATWSTPLLIKAGGREELVISFPNRLVAYDPKSGKQLWLSKGVGSTIYTTPVWGENTLYAMSSGPGGGGAIAVKPGGSGDVTESERLWRLERAKSAIGSGVIHGGHLYNISQDGIASCLNLKDGTTVWEERLKGAGSRSSSWSSMLLADGKIYVPNQSGDVFVLRASPKFELLATNSVGEPTNASLAAANGELFMRTDKGLWCFAATK